jgi:hypothetical protein
MSRSRRLRPLPRIGHSLVRCSASSDGGPAERYQEICSRSTLVIGRCWLVVGEGRWPLAVRPAHRWLPTSDSRPTTNDSNKPLITNDQ